MSGIIVACLVLFIFLGLLALFTRAYAAFWYKVFVSDKFEVINALMTTGDVPQTWRVHLLENALRRNPAASFCKPFSSVLAKWYVLRLKRLLAYVQGSSLIKDNDKQEYRLAFQEIQTQWESGGIGIEQ